VYANKLRKQKRDQIFNQKRFFTEQNSAPYIPSEILIKYNSIFSDQDANFVFLTYFGLL